MNMIMPSKRGVSRAGFTNEAPGTSSARFSRHSNTHRASDARLLEASRRALPVLTAPHVADSPLEGVMTSIARRHEAGTLCKDSREFGFGAS